jgi:hypothetical protein
MVQTPGAPAGGGSINQTGPFVTLHYHEEHLPLGVFPKPPADTTPGEPEFPAQTPPAPTLTSLNPDQGNRSDVTNVTAVGTEFDDKSVVVLNGVEVATTFTSATELGFAVDGPALGPGFKDVLVRKGSAESNTVQFRVT